MGTFFDDNGNPIHVDRHLTEYDHVAQRSVTRWRSNYELAKEAARIRSDRSHRRRVNAALGIPEGPGIVFTVVFICVVTLIGSVIYHFWQEILCYGVAASFLAVALFYGFRRGGLPGMIGAVVRVALWLALLATTVVTVYVAAMSTVDVKLALVNGPWWAKDFLGVYTNTPVYTMLHTAFTSMPLVSLIVGFVAGIVLFFRSMFWLVFPVHHY